MGLEILEAGLRDDAQGSVSVCLSAGRVALTTKLDPCPPVGHEVCLYDSGSLQSIDCESVPPERLDSGHISKTPT